MFLMSAQPPSPGVIRRRASPRGGERLERMATAVPTLAILSRRMAFGHAPGIAERDSDAADQNVVREIR